MRRLRTFAFALVMVLGLALLVFVFCMRDRYVVPILAYHHVNESANKAFLNNVTPRAFAWQMKFIAKHNYHVISSEDYVEGVKKGQSFARNTVVIQFDDGYEDNYTNAYPVLQQYGFSAAVFLISDSIGTPGFLTWAQVQEMDSHDFRAGAHTRRHVYLPEAPLDVARDEIAGCKKIIEEHLGHPVDFFAYPSGGFTDEVEGIVRQAGYKAAGTTNRGREYFNRNLFELNRIRVKNSDTSLTMWAKLSGYYNLFRTPKCSGGGKCKDYD